MILTNRIEHELRQYVHELLYTSLYNQLCMYFGKMQFAIVY